LKKLIRKHFGTFIWFYGYLRHKIFIAVCLAILVGLLDGFGLTMFLPLLQMVSGDGAAIAEGMGNLGFLVEWIEQAGIGLSLVSILLFMIVFFVLKGIAKYASEVYRVILQQQLIRKIRLDLLNALNAVRFKYFVTSDVGRIQNTMTGEVDRIQQAYVYYFQTFENIILVIVYMSFAFFVDYQFAILVSIGGALTNFLYKAVYKHTIGASKKLTDDSNVFQGQVIQQVANFKYLRATGMVNTYSKRLMQTIHKIEASRRQIGVLSGLLVAAREPLLIIVVASVIFIQINVLQGNLGAILISLLFFYRALTSLTATQNDWNRFLETYGSIDNLQSFQRDLQQNQQPSQGKSLAAFKHEIQLQQAGFSYGASTIIDDVSLTITKNQSIAFVGESGSGKTTLVNMVAGLLPCDQGEMRIDGVDITSISVESYQKRIGYITQEPVIFNDTIFNNVTFWASRTAENEEKCVRALQKASVHQFVSDQPLGLETPLGNNGINLSGGQKQRISIARELYKDIDILIMDEATSALDSETEKMIQENIEALKGQYTILMVAHRLSTIKNADCIVLMDKGRIKEMGNFQELIERVPRFKKMVKLQDV
jgi:ABC-type multidrug transport system fused ATPase/permease subunit